jgi:hypothetical protein
MVKVQSFIRKNTAASNDYEQAYNIIKDIKAGETISATADNIKAFRKYVCDLAMKNNKQIATRLQPDKSLNITCLTHIK